MGSREMKSILQKVSFRAVPENWVQQPRITPDWLSGNLRHMGLPTFQIHIFLKWKEGFYAPDQLTVTNLLMLGLNREKKAGERS